MRSPPIFLWGLLESSMTLLLSLLATLLFVFGVVVDAQFTCNSTQPCTIGCCTKFGSCGFGPDSCSPTNCISNCNRKSECDPGWGPQWSAQETCPLNVCCSKYGFCGTTPEICGSTTATAPSCSGSSSSKRTIGYYESWGIERSCNKMYPERIPVGVYTHLNFVSAFIHPTTFAMAPMNPEDHQLYTRFTAMKNTNPGLQTWISVGGRSMNDPDQPTAATFSNLVGSTDSQSKFFVSVLSFLETYGFDGVDLDWEYPVAPERSGKPSDYKNFVTFLQNFRNILHSSGHSYGLTVTIPSSFWYLQHFDVVSMEKIIDWFNLMSYDSLGPYIAAHPNLTEIDDALSLLWHNGINPENVVLGLGFYDRSFTLANPECASGAKGRACMPSIGTLSYAEIQRIVASGAKVSDNTYNHTETLKMKVAYANAHCLGGTMFCTASTDDAGGSTTATLLLAGRQVIPFASKSVPDPLLSCQFGECGQPCPAGLSPARRNDPGGKGNTGTDTECSEGSLRLYCCPSNDMPTCRWRGQAPFCGAAGGNMCNSAEVEVASSIKGTGGLCWTGHKVLCCTKTGSSSAAGHCEWKGTSPFCSNDQACPSSQKALTQSLYGAGGEQPCFFGRKSFCCDQPPPYTGCGWYGKTTDSIATPCTGGCPAGKAMIATDSSMCWSGYMTFCCDNPSNSQDPLVEDFKRRITIFANNPTCVVGQRQYSRYDSEFGYNLSQASSLGKRTTLSNADLTILLQQISQIAHSRVRTYIQSLMISQFDMLYGDRHGLYIADVATFHGDWPNADEMSLTKSLLCMGRDASDFLSDYHQSRTRLCVNPCASPRRRDIIPNVEYTLRRNPIASSVFPRNLGDSETPWRQGIDGEPSWGLIMMAIMQNLMQFEYAQIIRTSSDQTILELAWRLPEVPPTFGLGPSNIDPDYQDHNPMDSDIAPDSFVVFHFHADYIVDYRDSDYVGISVVNAFHGQDRDDWGRVDGNDRRQRAIRVEIMGCNVPAGTTFETFPGEFTDDQTVDLPPRASMLTRFGNYLVALGLLTPATFTGPNQGGLGLRPPDACGRREFIWVPGRYRTNQFHPRPRR